MDLAQANILTGAELLRRISTNSPKDYSKLVNTSYHKTLPLVSLCYSSMCNLGRPLDPNWDEVTLSCRGIIINTETKEIVAKPWNKFFNYDPEIHKHNLTEGSYILEKLDGSLGITYREPAAGARIRIATKNSFQNEMTAQANAWLERKIEENGYDFFDRNYTYLFEIIYPENYSTVIDYGDRRECVLLGKIHTETGEEMPFETIQPWAEFHKVATPKRYTFENFRAIVEHCKTLPWNDEGYVVTLPEHGYCKYKLKGSQFVEIHRLVFGLGPRRIWKAVRDHTDIPKMLEAVPSEIKEAKLEIYNQIVSKRDEIIANARSTFKEIYEEGMSRKDFALKVQELPNKSKGLMFALLDGNSDKLEMAAIKQLEDQYKQKEETIQNKGDLNV